MDDISESAEHIANRLARALNDPGLLAKRHRNRARFSPSLSYGRHFAPPQPDAKQAAVLVAMEPRERGWAIPLTVRPTHLPDHPGQISFPGGRLEENESHLEAAKREFEEELGAAFDGVVVGELLPIYVYNSNYFVRPYLAVSRRTVKLAPCKHEVDRVIHLPVSTLNNPLLHEERNYCRGAMCWRATTFRNGSDHVWGATAIMLGDVAAVVGA